MDGSEEPSADVFDRLAGAGVGGLMSRIRVVVAACAALSAVACAPTIHKKDKIDTPAQAIAVDAKQRFLVTTARPKPANGTDTNAELRKICLEPSPDVFSVISATLAANGKYGAKASAEFKAAMSEAGATIGTRTETIQLLRDAMYRICELAMNGDMDETVAANLHRSYQKSMVTLAAVAALADASRPSQVALTSRATLTPATLMADLAAEIDKQKVTRKTQDTDSQSADKALADSQGKVCEKKVASPDDCEKDSSKCADNATGTALCDAKTAGRDDRLKKYCELNKDADVCKDLTKSATAAADAKAALQRTDDTLAKLQAEFDRIEKNPDLSTATDVVQLAPTVVRQDPATIEKISSVVDHLVTVVYAEPHVESCLDLLNRASALDAKSAALLQNWHELDEPGGANLSSAQVLAFTEGFEAAGEPGIAKDLKVDQPVTQTIKDKTKVRAEETKQQANDARGLLDYCLKISTSLGAGKK